MLETVKFLHPGFLYGLFILIIPIIIHLFSFKRYKKIYFSNFTFLQALQQEKKNSSQLKKWLLLLLRLLALSAVVIAFANPYLPPADGHGQQSAASPVAIYIDNSFSMSNTSARGALLEEAKKYMFDILNAYPAGTGFMLLTNDNANRTLLSKEEAANTISGIKTTPAIKTLSDIFKQIKEQSANQPVTLFLLSDFQRNMCDFQQITPDTLITPVFLLLKPENLNNLFVKNVLFEQTMLHRKNQNDGISITVAGSSDKDVNNVPLNLTLNNKVKSIAKTNIPANREETVEINYLNTENGFYKGTVEITDFPVIFDNKFYFSYEITGKINVLCIEEKAHNPFFGKLFSDTADFNIHYVHAGQTSNISFNDHHLIILNKISLTGSGQESALENYVRAGGNLFIIPGDKLSVNTQNQLLQKMHAPQLGTPDTTMHIARLEQQSPIFKDVFEKQDENTLWPTAKTYYPLTNTPLTEILLRDQKNHTVLASQIFGMGKIYVSAFDFDPENSDMVYHPLFVPVMINASYHVQAALNTSWFLGDNKPVGIPGKRIAENARLSIRKEDRTFEFIPEIRKDFNGNFTIMNTHNIQDAGLYEIVQNDEVIGVLAYNYDRSESELNYSNEKELKKYFPAATVENIKTTQLSRNSEIVKEIVFQDRNKYLSAWLFLLAAVTLLFEQFVWRRKLK